jgi:hypothetical protein
MTKGWRSGGDEGKPSVPGSAAGRVRAPPQVEDATNLGRHALPRRLDAPVTNRAGWQGSVKNYRPEGKRGGQTYMCCSWLLAERRPDEVTFGLLMAAVYARSKAMTKACSIPARRRQARIGGLANRGKAGAGRTLEAGGLVLPARPAEEAPAPGGVGRVTAVASGAVGRACSEHMRGACWVEESAAGKKDDELECGSVGQTALACLYLPREGQAGRDYVRATSCPGGRRPCGRSFGRTGVQARASPAAQGPIRMEYGRHRDEANRACSDVGLVSLRGRISWSRACT